MDHDDLDSFALLNINSKYLLNAVGISVHKLNIKDDEDRYLLFVVKDPSGIIYFISDQDSSYPVTTTNNDLSWVKYKITTGHGSKYFVYLYGTYGKENIHLMLDYVKETLI